MVGFGERIHWFRVDGRSIGVKKKVCDFKNIRILVDVAQIVVENRHRPMGFVIHMQISVFDTLFNFLMT